MYACRGERERMNGEGERERERPSESERQREDMKSPLQLFLVWLKVAQLHHSYSERQ